MLPIVQRELRTAVRHPKFYRWRLWMAIIELIVAYFVVAGDNPLAAGRNGGGFFSVLAWTAFLFCLFEGLRKTSDAVSEEKREGTLGLLFLTDLNGFDIVLGKLAGAMVRSFNALLIFVPILAITLIAGGKTLGEFWRTVLSLAGTLWFSLSICLLISCLTREKHLSASVMALVAFVLLPLIVGESLRAAGNNSGVFIRALNPFMVFMQASDAYYSARAAPYWFGIGAQHLIGWLCLILASFVLPRSWQDKPGRTRVKARSIGNAEEVLLKRRELLDRNPILWLAYRERDHRNFKILFYGLLIVCIGLVWISNYQFRAIGIGLAISLVVLNLLIYVQIASQASLSLGEAKRTGAMELLLSTPLKVANIVEGEWLALRKMFMAPVIIVFVIYLLTFLAAAFGNSSITIVGLFYSANYMLNFGLGVFVLAWLGMWMGLTSKSPNRGLFKTVLFGMVLPYFPFCIPTLLIQVVLLIIAREKVTYNFRRFIAERYLQAPGFILPPPLIVDGKTPPVIRS